MTQDQASMRLESISHMPEGVKASTGINTPSDPQDLGEVNKKPGITFVSDLSHDDLQDRAMGLVESRFQLPEGVNASIGTTITSDPQDDSQGRANETVESNITLPDPALIELGSIGQDLIAAMQFRIANENRLRNAQRHHPDNSILHAMIGEHVKDAQGLEDNLLKEAIKKAKTIPYVQLMMEQPGVGPKSAVKLIAMAGDPIWHDRDKRIRTSGEWRYVLGMTPTSGRGPWSNTTRPILYNLAGVAVRGYIDPYRSIYDEYKEQHAEAVHTSECKRCGVLVCKWDGCTEGEHPGAPHAGHARKKIAARAGDPLTKGHIDARARRIMMSEFADLFYRVRREMVD